jgi:SSS family solute:Na+ symporter
MIVLWVPCVFLGVMANRITDSPRIEQKIEARRTLATEGAKLTPEERDQLRAKMNADDVLLVLLERYAPLWLAGLLGAGIMAAVMASDSQILALSTMFTEDIFAFYGGKRRFGEHVQIQTGRLFIVLITIVAYLIALRAPQTIFDLAVQYAFSGYAALMPLLVAALFWKGSTKWGALASTLWSALAVAGVAVFQAIVPTPAPGPPVVAWSIGSVEILSRTPGGTAVFGFMPVVPMVIVSILLMIIVSMMTAKPGQETIARYFSKKKEIL